jgi:hypothetical protein
MELESIVLYFNKKDLAADKIHTKINHVLGEGTVGYSIVSAPCASKVLQILQLSPRGP